MAINKQRQTTHNISKHQHRSCCHPFTFIKYKESEISFVVPLTVSLQYLSDVLRVIVNENSKWNCHVDYIIAKATKKICSQIIKES